MSEREMVDEIVGAVMSQVMRDIFSHYKEVIFYSKIDRML